MNKKLASLAVLMTCFLFLAVSASAETTLCWGTKQNPYHRIAVDANNRVLVPDTPEWDEATEMLQLRMLEGDEWAELTFADMANTHRSGMDEYRIARVLAARNPDATDLDLLVGVSVAYTASDSVEFLTRITGDRFLAVKAMISVWALNQRGLLEERRASFLERLGDPVENLERYRKLCPDDFFGLLKLKGQATTHLDWKGMVPEDFGPLCVNAFDEGACLWKAFGIRGENTAPLWAYVNTKLLDRPEIRLSLSAEIAEFESDENSRDEFMQLVLNEAERSGEYCVAGIKYSPAVVLNKRWEERNGPGGLMRRDISTEGVEDYLDMLHKLRACPVFGHRYAEAGLRGLHERLVPYEFFAEQCQELSKTHWWYAYLCAQGAAVYGQDRDGFEEFDRAVLLAYSENKFRNPWAPGYSLDYQMFNEGGDTDYRIARMNLDMLRCLFDGCQEEISGLNESAMDILEQSSLNPWYGNMLAPVVELVARHLSGADAEGYHRLARALNLSNMISSFERAGITMDGELTLPLDMSRSDWPGTDEGWTAWHLAATRYEKFQFKPPKAETEALSFIVERLNQSEEIELLPEGRTVFISMGAEWCPPCRAEMPFLVDELLPLLKKSDSDLRIISLDREPSKFHQLLKDIDLDEALETSPDVWYFDQGGDRFGTLRDALGLPIVYPTNLVFHDRRLIGWTTSFPHGQNATKVAEAIAELVATTGE